jgi:anionic cell wall polymer biosynthesis LytR-Cps2A-Psr (LCP) family protein
MVRMAQKWVYVLVDGQGNLDLLMDSPAAMRYTRMRKDFGRDYGRYRKEKRLIFSLN